MFLCTASAAGLTFGAYGAGAGSEFGYFTVNGNSTATGQLVSIGYSNLVVHPIFVENSLGDGIALNGAQNLLVENPRSQNHANSSFVLDRGAGSITVPPPQFASASTYALDFRQSALSSRPLAAHIPSNNTFIGGDIEFPGTTVGGGTVGVASGLHPLRCRV